MKKITKTISAILCILFVYGVFELVSLRFMKGDKYPKYSSFRADPMGIKGLYDSLSELESIDVKRNLTSLKESNLPYANSVLFVTGIMSDADNWKNDKDYYHYILKGGRLVIFFSQKARGFYVEDDTLKKSEMTTESKEMENGGGKEKEVVHKVKEQKYCKFGFALKRFNNLAYSKKSAELADIKLLERINDKTLTFYTNNHLLTSPKEDWNILYKYRDKPMIIEKKIGKGSLIVSSMSYCISNEGLQKYMPVEFITHILKKRKLIVFDEFIHGIKEQKNIAWLARKYNLIFLLINIMIVILLFIWKNFNSIKNIETTYSYDSSSIYQIHNNNNGIINLLKNFISQKVLIKECITECQKTIKYKRFNENKKNKIEEIRNNTNKNIVENYNNILKEYNK